jgi:hypothetical protein
VRRSVPFAPFAAFTAAVFVGVGVGAIGARVCAAQDAGAGASDAGPAEAAVTCEHTLVPGRVRCELEAHAGPGESIAWGDAVLVEVPAFATALRGRIGPSDAEERIPERWRWAFALVARERGHGELTARVRLVVCRGAACTARELPVTGRVSVGPES